MGLLWNSACEPNMDWNYMNESPHSSLQSLHGPISELTVSGLQTSVSSLIHVKVWWANAIQNVIVDMQQQPLGKKSAHTKPGEIEERGMSLSMLQKSGVIYSYRERLHHMRPT